MASGDIVDLRELIDLGRVGSVRATLDDLPAERRDELEPYVLALPLVGLVTHLLRISDRADPEERPALDRLALAIVARWQRPSQLFDELLSTALSEASNVRVRLEVDEHPLALTLLELQAQVLADHGQVERGRACLRLAARIAEESSGPVEFGMVLCSIALYERDYGNLDQATDAAQRAHALLAGEWPKFAEHAGQILTSVFTARALQEGAQDPPETLLPLLEAHPDQHRNLLIVLADTAGRAGDVVSAKRYVGRARAITAPASPEVEIRLLMVETKIARKSGAFEEAALSLDRIRTSRSRDTIEDDLAWEEYFLSRDLENSDTADRLVRLSSRSDQLDYHRGTQALREGDDDTARECFAQLAEAAEDPRWRATAKAMLANVAESRTDFLRWTYAAIGEFVALGMAIDHATALANLGSGIAAREIGLVADEHPLWAGDIEANEPQAALPAFAERVGSAPLARAARLVREASRIAHHLGATPQLLGWRQNEARIADAAGDARLALELLRDAIAVADASYLLTSDRSTAATMDERRNDLYEQAIGCTVRLEEVAEAARLAEQAKARRLYRDRVEVGALDGSAELAQLVEIRRRLNAEVWTSVAERRRVLEATIRTLGGLRTLPPVLKLPENEERFGGGAIVCATCLVDNAVGAMFCSACEHLLPKTFSGSLPPDPVHAYATHCYNRAQHLLAQGELSDAAGLLRTALKHRDHQDYWFFLGVCLSGLRDPDGAIEAIDRTGADQWSGELPVWYPPLSPSELAERRRELCERVDSALVFEQLATRISQNSVAQRELS